jgi:hypothetical protein
MAVAEESDLDVRGIGVVAVRKVRVVRPERKGIAPRRVLLLVEREHVLATGVKGEVVGLGHVAVAEPVRSGCRRCGARGCLRR